MNNIYAQKVDLLLRIIPIIFQEKSFAIHGGTAINLFEKDIALFRLVLTSIYGLCKTLLVLLVIRQLK
ncbi:MAG: hypothetical protein ACOX4D_00220 [Bacteroidales bacterium]|jgi:hypothetical protein